MHIRKETVSTGKVVFIRVNETAQGGFTLHSGNIPKGTVIEAGTVVYVKEEERLAIVKAGGNTEIPEGYIPLGLLYNDVVVDENHSAGVSVVVDGTVYENRIPGVAEEVKAKMPKILFSKSF